jgi:hypothetical protein
MKLLPKSHVNCVRLDSCAYCCRSCCYCLDNLYTIIFQTLVLNYAVALQFLSSVTFHLINWFLPHLLHVLVFLLYSIYHLFLHCTSHDHGLYIWGRILYHLYCSHRAEPVWCCHCCVCCLQLKFFVLESKCPDFMWNKSVSTSRSIRTHASPTCISRSLMSMSSSTRLISPCN